MLGQLESAKQKLTLEGDGWALPVTNLDKVLWPATADRPPITKRDLLRYAITIAPLALPHLRDRPLTLLRFPNGIDGKKFYQRHWDTERPPFVDAVSVFADGENTDRNFLCCNNLPALLWLCQVADIEWHASLARTSPEPDAHGLSTTFSGSAKALEASTLNYPDFLLFDLDPYIYAGTEKRGDEPQPNRAAFEATCGIAHALKKLLDALGLESFVKTSGATGVHIYVPVERQFDYGVIRAAANTVCTELAAQRPKEVTLEWATERRTGKVFLDANQNARHKSLAAPYSPRAKPGGPVSLPQRSGRPREDVHRRPLAARAGVGKPAGPVGRHPLGETQPGRAACAVSTSASQCDTSCRDLAIAFAGQVQGRRPKALEPRTKNC